MIILMETIGLVIFNKLGCAISAKKVEIIRHDIFRVSL